MCKRGGMGLHGQGQRRRLFAVGQAAGSCGKGQGMGGWGCRGNGCGQGCRFRGTGIAEASAQGALDVQYRIERMGAKIASLQARLAKLTA